MGRPKKAEPEIIDWHEWAEEIKPFERGDKQYLEIEDFVDFELFECLEFEIIKRQLTPIQTLYNELRCIKLGVDMCPYNIQREICAIDFKKNFIKINYSRPNPHRKLFQIELDMSKSEDELINIIQEVKKKYSKEYKNKKYHGSYMGLISEVVHFGSSHIYGFGGLMTKGSEKTKQQKAADLFFIWDCIVFGHKDAYIIDRLNEYQKDIGMNEQFSKNTLRAYKKHLAKYIPSKQPDEMTFQLFLDIYGLHRTAQP